MIDHFKFSPGEKVLIKPLEMTGRILRCYAGMAAHEFYEVEYWLEGELKRADLLPDDLGPA